MMRVVLEVALVGEEINSKIRERSMRVVWATTGTMVGWMDGWVGWDVRPRRVVVCSQTLIIQVHMYV